MSKSQADSEATAKVYQLDALASQLEGIGKQLETVLTQTSGLVTNAQLEVVKTEYKEDIAEAVKDIHAEYRPTLKRTNWLYTTVIGEAIALLVAAISVIFLIRN